MNIQLDLDKTARRYYAQLDWDYETGQVKRERLEALGLAEMIDRPNGRSGQPPTLS
jgi:hypothetical protein